MSDDIQNAAIHNKRVIETYFRALDRGELGALPDMFAQDCLIHRPGLKEPLKGIDGISSVVASATERYQSLKTTINSLIAEDNMVACRLTHHAKFARPWATRMGTFDVSGRSVVWHPIVLFRMSRGKVAEQWVCRDELGMLMDLEVLPPAS